MRYKSTRNPAQHVSAAEAVMQGIAPEGGLYLPETIPQLSQTQLAHMATGSYLQQAQAILSHYFTPASGWSEAELQRELSASYGAAFRSPQVVPLHRLNANTHVLELFHGPTCAFKDIALQLLPHLLTQSMRTAGAGKQVVILVATSGDTGKAALEGFCDVPGTQICVYYPQHGVSAVQARQMTTQQGNNVQVVAVQGNFDDAQTGVKAMLGNPVLQQQLQAQNKCFSSANSINWGRLAPQIVYYFSAYFALLQAQGLPMGTPVHVAVPTGNFGDILAGYYAKRMGLPLQKLICASNQNCVLTDFLQTGVYDRRRPFYATSSPSMDILISSNLERLLYLASGQEEQAVAGWMQALASKGSYTVPAALLKTLQSDFVGESCNEEQTAAAIRKAWQEHRYVSDPHTAVALHALEQYRATTSDPTPAVVLATASPFKFAGSVLAALEQPVPQDAFAALDHLQAYTQTECPPPLQGLQNRELRFSATCTPSEMHTFL